MKSNQYASAGADIITLSVPKMDKSMFRPLAALLAERGLEAIKTHKRKPLGLLGDTRTGEQICALRFERDYDAYENMALGLSHGAVMGFDKIQEYGGAVAMLDDLAFGQCRLMLAVSAESDMQKPTDLKAGMVVATSYPHLLAQYCRDRGINNIQTIVREGGVEQYIEDGIADAVLDITETGSTIQAYGLRVLEDNILRSSMRLVGGARAMQSPQASSLQRVASRITKQEQSLKLHTSPATISIVDAQRCVPMTG